MDIISYALSKKYTKTEIAKVTSGIQSVTNTGSQLIFTLNDSSTITVTITGLSDANYTTTEKTKLASLNETILSKFSVVGGKLLFDNSPIQGGTVDLTNYYNKLEVDNLLLNKVNVDGTKVLTDVNFTQVDKNKLDALDNFSKDYTELINKPTIPSIVGLASETYVDNKVSSLPSQDLTPYEKIIDVDTKLVNKADLVHTHEMTSVIGLSDKFVTYYTKLETLSTTEINTLVNNISKGMSWKDSVDNVASLPLLDNTDTDTRITKDTLHINIWSANLNKWIDLGGSDTIPMASELLDGKMSKEQYSKLESIVISNLATTQQLADGLATKSDTTHIHSNYVEKVIGASLPLDTKQAEWDAKADISSIPTKTSNLTNDSGFITSNDVDGKLINYETSTQVNTKLVDYAKVVDVSSAVANSHTHTNKTVIDKFTEVGGQPYYNGSAIVGGTIDMTTLPTF